MPINKIVKLCGARARRNKYRPCRQPAIKGKNRCRLHGGKSTGPVTQDGKDRAARANLKHGFYTKGMIAEKRRLRLMMQWRYENDDIRD